MQRASWRVSLEARSLGSSSIIVRMSAIRKLTAEAADNGLLAPEFRNRSREKREDDGVRAGNCLSVRQTQSLGGSGVGRIQQSLRDRAITAVLPGVRSTEGYLGAGQDLIDAPNDAIKLSVATR